MSNHQKTQGDMARAGHILKIALSHALCILKIALSHALCILKIALSHALCILKIALSHALCKVKLLCLNLMLHPFNVDQACGSQPGEPQQRNCRERYGGICETGVA